MTKNFPHDQRGSVAVELALVLPMLVFFLAGIVELGLTFWEQQVLSAAAREGARAATRRLDGFTDDRYISSTNLETLVKKYLEDGGMSSAGLTVNVTTEPIPGQWGSAMKIVTVTRPHTFSLFPGFFPSTIIMTGRASMAIEKS